MRFRISDKFLRSRAALACGIGGMAACAARANLADAWMAGNWNLFIFRIVVLSGMCEIFFETWRANRREAEAVDATPRSRYRIASLMFTVLMTSLLIDFAVGYALYPRGRYAPSTALAQAAKPVPTSLKGER